LSFSAIVGGFVGGVLGGGGGRSAPPAASAAALLAFSFSAMVEFSDAISLGSEGCGKACQPRALATRPCPAPLSMRALPCPFCAPSDDRRPDFCYWLCTGQRPIVVSSEMPRHSIAGSAVWPPPLVSDLLRTSGLGLGLHASEKSSTGYGPSTY
jgi:hypothetical protein